MLAPRVEARIQSGWSRGAYWGVEAAILKRLAQYHGVRDLPEERRAVGRMFDILGRRMGPKMRRLSGLPERYASPYIAFPELTERLTRDPKVHRAMETIANEISTARAGRKPYDLWGAVEREAGSSKAALEWMAVLFQDSPRGGEYFNTLHPSTLKDALTRILEAVEAPRGGWSLQAFPGSVRSADPRLYHFYVPAYLAARVVETGIKPRSAVAVTFSLESEYQGFKARSLYMSPRRVALNMLGKGAHNTDFFDHPALTRALYLGYAGSMLGSGMGAPRLSPEAFAEGVQEEARALFAEIIRGA
jgi:hypothetical protein